MMTQPDEVPGPAWLHAIFGDDAFSEVSSLFPKQMLSDEDLVYVGRLTELRELSFSGVDVADVRDKTMATHRGWSHLSGLTNLEWLNLEKTSFRDEDLVFIQDHGSLQYVDLTDAAVTKTGIEGLKHSLNLNVTAKHLRMK